MVATIALDVLKGLEYMHTHSMLHRDVKVGKSFNAASVYVTSDIDIIVSSSAVKL